MVAAAAVPSADKVAANPDRSADKGATPTDHIAAAGPGQSGDKDAVPLGRVAASWGRSADRAASVPLGYIAAVLPLDTGMTGTEVPGLPSGIADRTGIALAGRGQMADYRVDTASMNTAKPTAPPWSRPHYDRPLLRRPQLRWRQAGITTSRYPD